MAMTLTPSRLRVTQAKFFGDYNAGGSGVTNLTEGTGIDLTPNPLINTGTIALQTPVIPAHGGTGANLSATGGAGQYVKQVGVGANFTVGTIPYTDIGAGFVKIDGTTPLTADWQAGAARTIKAGVVSANRTTAAGPLSVGGSPADINWNWGGQAGLGATANCVAVADGTAASPSTNGMPMLSLQRYDSFGAVQADTTIPVQITTWKKGGSGNHYALHCNTIIDAAATGTYDSTAITGFVNMYAGSATGALPDHAISGYPFWGSISRTEHWARMIGMELDITDNSGFDSGVGGTYNDSFGIVVYGSGLAAHTTAYHAETSNGTTSAFRNAYVAGTDSYKEYGLKILPSAAAGAFPIRIPNATAIVARNAGDTADIQLIRGNGVSTVEIAMLGGATNFGGVIATGNEIVNTIRVGVGAFASTTNVAVGLNSLASNVSGTAEVALGYNALNAVTTGANNTGVGHDALAHVSTNTDNTAVGKSALHATTAGANTGIGSGALAANTSGASNTAVGAGALALATTVSFNTAVGASALSKATGAGNTSCGFASLFEDTTGVANTAVGQYALKNNSTGARNVALGSGAGMYETGSDAFYVNNQDRTNTAGDKALSLLYGVMAAAAANQKLTVNGLFKLGVIPAPYANNAAALAGGLLAGDLYTVTGTDPRQIAIVF